jgi:predicted NodU family carbamoyl transferase
LWAALFRKGDLLAAAPEERFTRVKHQGGIPWNAIQFCLDSAGIEPEDVAGVSFVLARQDGPVCVKQDMGVAALSEDFVQKHKLRGKGTPDV